ncbi:hypothetical protein STENM223S_03973 [Streptomyces tendae]
MPSTWPCTMWPPRRSPTAVGRSRLTREPTARAPRLERFRVSAMTSAVNSSPSCSTTVRHTPLTAMESPCFAPWVTTGPRRRKRQASPRVSTAVISPSSSTIPVNTSRVLLPLRARTPGLSMTTGTRARTPGATSRTGFAREGRAPVRRRAWMPARRALPPIRTLTVGPGISPGQPVAGGDRVADCNRRFGLSPTPECAATGTGPVCHGRDSATRVSAVEWVTARYVEATEGRAMHNCPARAPPWRPLPHPASDPRLLTQLV